MAGDHSAGNGGMYMAGSAIVLAIVVQIAVFAHAMGYF